MFQPLLLPRLSNLEVGSTPLPFAALSCSFLCTHPSFLHLFKEILERSKARSIEKYNITPFVFVFDVGREFIFQLFATCFTSYQIRPPLFLVVSPLLLVPTQSVLALQDFRRKLPHVLHLLLVFHHSCVVQLRPRCRRHMSRFSVQPIQESFEHCKPLASTQVAHLHYIVIVRCNEASQSVRNTFHAFLFQAHFCRAGL